MDKPNLVTDTEYILSDTAALGKDCYTQLISRSHTIGSLIRRFMKILEFITAFGPVAKRMKELNMPRNKDVLEKEAWRAILLCSQRYFPFRELGKYNLAEIHGIKCNRTTNKPLAITL